MTFIYLYILKVCYNKNGETKTMYKPCNWNQLKEMVSSGLVEVGAHTVNHKILTQLPKAEILTELLDAKKIIEERISGTCNHFAYPNGKKEDFNSPIYTIRLIGLKEYSLSIFEKKDKNINQYPAVSSENDYPFMLPEYKANNIMLKPDEIIMNAG